MRGLGSLTMRRTGCCWVLLQGLVWEWQVLVIQSVMYAMQPTCSLNWWSMFSHYQMLAYSSAKEFPKTPLRTFLVVSGNEVGLMTTRMFKNSRRICRPYELSTHLWRVPWRAIVEAQRRWTKYHWKRKIIYFLNANHPIAGNEFKYEWLCKSVVLYIVIYIIICILYNYNVYQLVEVFEGLVVMRDFRSPLDFCNVLALAVLYFSTHAL